MINTLKKPNGLDIYNMRMTSEGLVPSLLLLQPFVSSSVIYPVLGKQHYVSIWLLLFPHYLYWPKLRGHHLLVNVQVFDEILLVL